MNNQSIKNSGVFWMILAVFSLSIMQVFIRLTSDAINVFQQVMFRNLFGIFVAAYFIHKEDLSWFGEKKQQPYLFGRSFLGFMGLVFFFYATRDGTIADATIINNTNPFFTTLFSFVFLKQKVKFLQWVALFIVLIGGAITVDATFSAGFYVTFFAFLSAIANGGAYTLLAYFKEKVSAMTVIMHFSTFCVLACIPFAFFELKKPTVLDVICLIFIGILGSIGQIALTNAYRLAPAAKVAIWDQLSIVLSVVLGYIIFGQVLTVRTFVGGFIIISTSIWSSIVNTEKRMSVNLKK